MSICAHCGIVRVHIALFFQCCADGLKSSLLLTFYRHRKDSFLIPIFKTGKRNEVGWMVSGEIALLHAGYKTGLVCTTVYL
jgi:hypothetical protein